MMRRSLLALLGLPLVGDGLVRPQNAPVAQQPPVGVQPGTTSAIVRANTVIVFGPTGAPVGIFIYQPGTTPAFGNQPIAWMTANTKDPFGNVLPSPGIGTQTGFGWIDMLGASLQMAVAGQPSAQAALLKPVIAGESQLTSGQASGGDTPAVIDLRSAGVTGAFPLLHLTGTALVVDGAVTATAGTASSPTVIETDTWHNLTLSAGFTAGSRAPQYRLYPDNSVRFRGRVQLTGTEAAGTSFVAAVAWPYAASTTTGFVTSNSLSGYAAGVQTWTANASGSLAIQASGVSGNTFDLDNCEIALD